MPQKAACHFLLLGQAFACYHPGGGGGTAGQKGSACGQALFAFLTGNMKACLIFISHYFLLQNKHLMVMDGTLLLRKVKKCNPCGMVYHAGFWQAERRKEGGRKNTPSHCFRPACLPALQNKMVELHPLGRRRWRMEKDGGGQGRAAAGWLGNVPGHDCPKLPSHPAFSFLLLTSLPILILLSSFACW